MPADLDLMGVKAGLLLIPAAVAALAVLVRKAWTTNVLLVLALREIVGTKEKKSLAEQVADLHREVKVLKADVHPNHGQTLGEAVHEIRIMAGEAKQKAADAASEAEGMAGALARFHRDAQQRADDAARERAGVRESLDTITQSILDYARSGYQQRVAYVSALQELGIDLSHVTNALDEDVSGDSR